MSNPLNYQVGGSHYSQMTIQPIEFAHKNGLGPCETLVLKYICRWKMKDGLRDLEKAIHCLQILIEMETNAQKAATGLYTKDGKTTFLGGLAPKEYEMGLQPASHGYGASDREAVMANIQATLGGYIPEDP